MRKEDVLKIIDEVMNNREIDSIRNAILAIRDKVIMLDESVTVELDMMHIYKIPLRGGEPCITFPYFDDAKYICIDPCEKIDTAEYGAIWYE